jgi:predicted dehydrogenase
MTTPIRLAIVGCGRVVETFHAPALRHVDEFRPTVVVDADSARATIVAAEFGDGVAVCERIDDAIDRCDAALVALPNALHADACVQLLDAGRHVLVEKPMATTIADCDRIVRAAERAGATVGAAMVRRFIPAYGLVRHLIAHSIFGELRGVRVTEGVAYNWPAATGFFVKREQAGGGVLVDFGAHVLDALWWWLGPLSLARYEDDASGGVEAECRVQLAAMTRPVTVELTRLRNVSCVARIEWERGAVEIELRSGEARLSLAGTPYAIRGLAELDGSTGSRAATNPFVLQLRAFGAAVHEKAGVLETARTAREIAALFEECELRRQPLLSPAGPWVSSSALLAAAR